MSPYHIYCWNNKCNFSSFQGNVLKQFVFNANIISTFISDKLVKTSETESLLGTLHVLPLIFDFIRISRIQNKEKYVHKLRQFELNVRLLFKYGRNTFLSDGNVSFYFHSLRFYLPQLALLTFERHGLGLGVFTMQGYERRNKESKNTIKRFCTLQHTSNKLLVNNIRRVLQVFLFEINAY